VLGALNKNILVQFAQGISVFTSIIMIFSPILICEKT
jgi:hypothetical protein